MYVDTQIFEESPYGYGSRAFMSEGAKRPFGRSGRVRSGIGRTRVAAGLAERIQRNPVAFLRILCATLSTVHHRHHGRSFGPKYEPIGAFLRA